MRGNAAHRRPSVHCAQRNPETSVDGIRRAATLTEGGVIDPSMDWQHTVRGVNTLGLKRAGFDEKRIRAIREAFRILFRKGRNLRLAIKELEESGRANQDVAALLDFIKASKRGVCVGASESRS